MARAIIVLRHDEQPCPFDDEGATPFTDEQIAAFLEMDRTVEIVLCPHHEPIVMANLPPGYTWTPSTSGQVKAVIHASDEQPVIPEGEPHRAPEGVSEAEAIAQAEAEVAANPGATGPNAQANTTEGTPPE